MSLNELLSHELAYQVPVRIDADYGREEDYKVFADALLNDPSGSSCSVDPSVMLTCERLL